MDPGPLLDRALDDEAITAGLDEADPMRLIAALSDRIRAVATAAKDPAAARRQTELLCRHAREISRQVAATTPEATRTDLFRRLLNDWAR